ncbi:hypothetical protein VN12_09890 [Pirellula sp. SH-Sr6A]|uniref:hypothetical protein n=1 Tax=Pirellula sp. SH-Sr6A TaxID=1632865 RepID=UPI00078CE9A5|nr:hypothetical protein [Pirellula sp. SH-Sr6A]AMV32425.1 hypothetical protein VN12_09890 [Pirellula sp. SH-Sr6A]
MTVEPQPHCENADLDLRAMLYALGDPSIDRLDFESLMESTPEAMEAVARAVEIIHGVKEAQLPSSPAAGKMASVQRLPVPPRPSGWLPSTVWTVAACSLAASLLVLIILWKPDAELSRHSDWSAIASAWSDVQSTLQPTVQSSPDSDTSLVTGAPASESGDFLLASFELVDESESMESEDIPSWLIMAASSVHSPTEESLQ